MEIVNTLRRYGLFDAKVPRYTSFPPANRFVPGLGAQVQRAWMAALPLDEPVSIYVHIPFCRRLCWFCACRTQGTKTLRPVEGYLDDLLTEIASVSAALSGPLPMARLHLGGGTPTLLDPGMMARLLECIHTHFSPTPDFEFSVEIDPTEAAEDVLNKLSDWQMRRASIGVQDFNPKVQEAIGRPQSFDQTRDVIAHLKAGGVKSINIDMLYGLPYQNVETLADTLEQVVFLGPDRVALYGYAHVPHVSKRQVMIPDEALPDAERRFLDARLAHGFLLSNGYVACGIDHFARPSDRLAQITHKGALRRNFQGYTDDPCETLLGFGASAISKFPQGYVQNAVATAAYRERVAATGFAAHKGYALTSNDALMGEMIDAIMCQGRIDRTQLKARHQDKSARIDSTLGHLTMAFPEALETADGMVYLRPGMEALARLLAAQIDQDIETTHIHSLAI